MTTTRGNWPNGYGVNHWDNPDVRRWAFYNIGAMMCGRDTGRWHGPEGPNGARRLEMPYSEVCMHMRVAGRRVWAAGADGPLYGGVDIAARMIQLYSDTGSRFGGAITRGEAGLH